MPTLDWIGKDKIINYHRNVPYCVLDRIYSYDSKGQHEEDNGSENMIIHGDNLYALKSLLPKYEGKIDCIFIDPPYNTGNKEWVYDDNVNDPQIQKWLGKTVGKEGEDMTRHDKWLCLMYPRLVLLKKLLSSAGSIFISIDDSEYASLKLLCDEIFGLHNYLATIVWQHSVQPKGYLTSFSVHHNYILCYSNDEYELRPLERKEEDNKAYSNPDNDPKGPWRSGDVRNALYRPNLIYDLITPSGKIIKPCENGWRWSKETMSEKISTGEIIFNDDETKIIRKIYLSTVSGRSPETIWFGKDVGTTREAMNELKQIFSKSPFDTPKPTRLIQQIMKIGGDKDAIILDSFAGSGTTGHAVIKQNAIDGGNRKFIMIEMMDYANELTAERIKRVISGYDDAESIESSFSYYELGEPLMIDGFLNENVDIEKIREYVLYTETKNQLCCIKPQFKYYLGKKDSTAYYFCYDKDKVVPLDDSIVANILQLKSSLEPGYDNYVIYADVCYLSSSYLKKHNIVFKKIPRDIGRF